MIASLYQSGSSALEAPVGGRFGRCRVVMWAR